MLDPTDAKQEVSISPSSAAILTLLSDTRILNRSDASTRVVNSTLVGNTAGGEAGGIMDMPDGGSMIFNSVLWLNLDAGGMDESAQIDSEAATVYYSCVQGWTGGLQGTAVIDLDPLFVDPDNGDLRLSPDSPCIDAGDNTDVPEDITTDLDGNPRFVDDPDTPRIVPLPTLMRAIRGTPSVSRGGPGDCPRAPWPAVQATEFSMRLRTW